MDKDNFLKECARFGAPLTSYSVDHAGDFLIVFNDRSKSEVYPCFARVFDAHPRDSSRASKHAVIVAYHKKSADASPEFWIWCGDSFCEGRLPAGDGDSRIAAAIQNASTHFPHADPVLLRYRLSSGYGCVCKSTGCNFWRARAKGDYCKHTKAVMTQIDSSTLDALESGWKALMQPDAGNPVACDDAAAAVMRSAFSAPVLMLGPPAAGKTHIARTMADDAALHYIEYGCHAGTEPADLLGCVAPFGREWTWKDGPVTEAFRRASRGERVVLCLDELLRVNGRYLTPLLTALSEFRGSYTLRTGRILSSCDGIGQEEIIKARADLLSVIATTNIGGEFDIDGLDPALRSRFKLVFVGGSGGAMKAALTEAIEARGWPATAVDQLLSLQKQTQRASLSGLISRQLDLRALKRCIQAVASFTEMAAAVWEERLQCVGLDAEGAPIAEEAEYFRKIVDKVFA